MTKICLLISFLIVVAVFILLPFTFSNEWRVRRSINLTAKAAEVYPYFTDIKHLQDWTSWSSKVYPDIKVTYSQQTEGIGAEMSWQSNMTDSGDVKITEIEPGKSVTFLMELNGQKSSIDSKINLVDGGDDKTLIRWRQKGDFGKNVLDRYLSLFMDTVVGPDMEKSLDRLKILLEKKSN